MSVGKIVSFSSLGSDIQDLIKQAIAVRELAYCPYSNFPVGATVLTDDDQVFTGCNVENVAIGGTICAERTAITKAVSNGKQKFKVLIVTASLDDEFVSPCGPCRQFLVEFGDEVDVYLAKTDLSTVLVTTIKELLPLHFNRFK